MRPSAVVLRAEGGELLIERKRKRKPKRKRRLASPHSFRFRYRFRRFSHIQLFANLWNLRSPPGSSVHGLLQARILEWVAISSFRGSSQVSCISCIGRQILYYGATWEALAACCTPGGLSDPGIKPTTPALAGRFFPTEPPGKPCDPPNILVHKRSLNLCS